MRETVVINIVCQCMAVVNTRTFSTAIIRYNVVDTVSCCNNWYSNKYCYCNLIANAILSILRIEL